MKRILPLLVLGTILSCTDDDGVINPDDANAWQNFTTSDGLISSEVSAIFEDSQARLWIGTSNGMMVLEDGEFSTFSSFNSQIGAISAITEDNNGVIWAGSATGFGQFNGSWSFSNLLGGLPIGVFALLTSADGRVWMSTVQDEILIFDGPNFSQLRIDECGPCNTVSTILEDSNGIMWFGSQGGLVRYDGSQFFFFNSANGALFDDIVLSIEEDDFERLWVGVLRGNLVTSFQTDGTQVSAIDFNLLNGVISSGVSTIHSMPNSDVWFGTNSGGIVAHDGITMRTVLDVNGPGLAAIEVIEEDSQGNIWVGTDGDGLWQFIP